MTRLESFPFSDCSFLSIHNQAPPSSCCTEQLHVAGPHGFLLSGLVLSRCAEGEVALLTGLELHSLLVADLRSHFQLPGFECLPYS